MFIATVGKVIDTVEQQEELGALGVAGVVERLRRRVHDLVGESPRKLFEHLRFLRGS
jgi:hypothetical protein